MMTRKLLAALLAPAAVFVMATGAPSAEARPSSEVLTEFYYDAAMEQYAGFTWLPCNGGFMRRGVTNTLYHARTQDACDTGGIDKICEDCSGGTCAVVACPTTIFACTDPNDPNCPPF